ncbi:hypothetical protein HHI36_017966 [Cryptolaemus montrouzieri]|uniref:Uncharacterized protein n=1 Tax=Cryptolaemus montrouzieri TaxID=559131 RepID=A0ABD2NYS8_9CUCU
MEKNQQELQKIFQFENKGIDDLTEQITSAFDVALKKINFTTNPAKKNLAHIRKKLISDKRKMKRNTEEFKDMERQLKKAIRKDLRQYNTKMKQNVINNKLNMKASISSRSRGRQKVHKVRYTDGLVIAERSEINNIIRESYAKLYRQNETHLQQTKSL